MPSSASCGMVRTSPASTSVRSAPRPAAPPVDQEQVAIEKVADVMPETEPPVALSYR
jgi:hypothetical protein